MDIEKTFVASRSRVWWVGKGGQKKQISSYKLNVMDCHVQYGD